MSGAYDIPYRALWQFSCSVGTEAYMQEVALS